MRTAVDTNVVLDLLTADPVHGRASADALRGALTEGAVVACEVVWAELSAAFASADEATRALARLGVSFDPMLAPAAAEAGEAWRRYRRSGGPRQRLIGDFLVGAHAARQADRLLSRDRGFYRRAFKGLAIMDPSQG